MAGRRKERLRRAVAHETRAGAPTPETVAKLRHDVVGRLVERGRLQRCHADAAEEIRSVSEAVGRGMNPTAQPTEWSGRVPDHRLPRDFLERMSAEERQIWQFRYLPWTRELWRATDTELPGPSWLRLVLGIVVENGGLRHTERCHGLRNGSAVRWLAAGLERYNRRPGRGRRMQVLSDQPGSPPYIEGRSGIVRWSDAPPGPPLRSE